MRNSYDDIDYIMLGIKGITATILVGIMGYLIGTKVDNLKAKEGTMKPVETIQETTEETEEVNEGDYKIFQPEEHYFTVRKTSKDCDPSILEEFETPEGYAVYGVVPYCDKDGDKIIDEGFRVDYVNTEPVVVYAHYNDKTGKYDYETSGYVLQTEKVREYNKIKG